MMFWHFILPLTIILCPQIFVANVDIDTVVRNTLPYPVKTRYVRITEYHFKSWISFRVEFYGCPIPKTLPLPTLMPPRTKQPTVENNATTHPSKETITLPSQPTVENNATTHPSKETIALPARKFTYVVLKLYSQFFFR